MDTLAIAFIILAPSLVLLAAWEVWENRRPVKTIGFWQMEEGKMYRVELEGREITGQFERYEADYAIFTDGQRIHKLTRNQVSVVEI